MIVLITSLIATAAFLWIAIAMLEDGRKWGDRFLTCMGIFGLLVASFFGLCVLAAIDQTFIHPCIKSHRAMVHHNAWTSFIMVGKVMVPQSHAAYDAEEDVCDQRK